MTDGTETFNADPDFPVDPDTAEPTSPERADADSADDDLPRGGPESSELDESAATDGDLPSEQGR